MLHKFRKTDATALNYAITWCGRSLPVSRTVLALSGVQCVKCREAFAKHLRTLPDVLPKQAEDGVK